jgi:hypothetical protein
VFNRIPSFNRLSNKSIQGQITEPDFSNNLSTMNTFYEDDSRDVMILGLKTVRFLPFFIFNTYVIGGGNYHSQMLQVLGNVKSFISHINNFKSSNISYGPLAGFIVDELVYFIEIFAKEMESPLTVNNKSRHMMVNLIAQSMREADDI